jgi:hypothetical protein
LENKSSGGLDSLASAAAKAASDKGGKNDFLAVLIEGLETGESTNSLPTVESEDKEKSAPVKSVPDNISNNNTTNPPNNYISQENSA